MTAPSGGADLMLMFYADLCTRPGPGHVPKRIANVSAGRRQRRSLTACCLHDQLTKGCDQIAPSIEPQSRFHNFRERVSVLAGVVVFVIAACGGPTPASGDVDLGGAQGDAIGVVALDNEFQPAILELEPGKQVTIEVDNQGQQPHNLVIDEVELSTGTLDPGDVATATFVVPDTPVTFYCSFHPGMTSELRPATD